MPPCRSECRGGALAPNDRDKIGHRAWRRRLDGPCAASPRSRRCPVRADLSARGANLAAHRLKLRSRLRDVYFLRPHPWAVDVTRNAALVTRHGRPLLGMQPIHMETFGLSRLRAPCTPKITGIQRITRCFARARARVGVRLIWGRDDLFSTSSQWCYQSSYALPVGTPMTGHGYQNRLRLRRSRIGAGGWFWVIPDFPGP